jgi:hypothetical protein
MKRYLTLGLAAVTAGLLTAAASAADEKTPIDPAGIWTLNVTFPGRPAQVSTLKLEKAGDRYVGVLSSARGGSTPVKDVQYKDGELSFATKFERQGQEITMLYKGKVTADSFNGQLHLRAGGRQLDVPFKAARAKDEAILAGSWKITITLDSGQKLRPTLVVKNDGGKLTGEYLGNSGQKVPAQDLKLQAGELSFSAPDKVEEDRIVFNFVGKLAGETIKGVAKFGTGNRASSLPFTASKSQAPTADVAGTWKLRVPMKDGAAFEPTLRLTQTGMALSGTYVGEQGETAIRDAMVLGDEVVFDVSREREGKKYRLHYQAKVQGDTLKGQVDYNFDGMTGYLEFEGKRVSPAKAQ